MDRITTSQAALSAGISSRMVEKYVELGRNKPKRRAGGRPFTPGPEASARARAAAQARWSKKRAGDDVAAQQRAAEQARKARRALGYIEPEPAPDSEPHVVRTTIPDTPPPIGSEPRPSITPVSYDSAQFARRCDRCGVRVVADRESDLDYAMGCHLGTVQDVTARCLTIRRETGR